MIEYQRFTDRARKVMQLANQEAIRYNHEYIGTEHILLGLVREGSGVAANVLKNLRIDGNKIRLEVESIIVAGPEVIPIPKLPQTPRAKKVLEFACDEARQLNHNYVGTEHLLLGLLRESGGVAAQVLLNLGLSLPALRGAILEIVGPPAGPPVAASAAATALSVPLGKAVTLLDELVELFQQSKEGAIAVQDFPWAVALRDEKEKLLKMKEWLLREGQRHPQKRPTAVVRLLDASVEPDLTVAEEPRTTARAAYPPSGPTNQFEIHLPAGSPGTMAQDGGLLEPFHRRLVERFGRVFCLREPKAGVLDAGTTWNGEAIQWWFYAADLEAAAAFLRGFRQELQQTLGVDHIVMVARQVTIV
jgi:hypothetical protein